MSRCGLRASCADVDTASKPMYAKKITPAPRRTPLQPYSPKVPVFGGMNGCQFAGSMNIAPAPITISRSAILSTTMTAFTDADSRTPMISSAVTATVIATAGTLKTAVSATPAVMTTDVPGAPLSAAGKLTPSCRRSVTKLPDHPTATVAAPSAYSRMRSQPITHAMNSPSVAYA